MDINEETELLYFSFSNKIENCFPLSGLHVQDFAQSPSLWAMGDLLHFLHFP